MDDKKIYELLNSDNRKQEDEGLKLLIQEKAYLMRKHGKRIPAYFNDEDKHSVFIYGIFKLFEKIKAGKFEYKNKGSLEAFLYILIDRKILNQIRRKKLDEFTVLHTNLFSITDKPFEEETLESVSRIFQTKLGQMCQQIMLMYHVDRMKLEEIAKTLNLALGTVKNNSSKCMNELKKLIKEDPNLGNYLRGLLKD